MSGIEVAGLALGAFPICIELVKLYMAGAETFEVMRHHRYVLDEFKRELEMEHIKFVNTIYEVFEDQITQKDYGYILLHEIRDSTSSSSEPNTQDLVHLIENRFNRPYAFKGFIDAVKALKDQLKYLEGILDLPALHSDTGSTMTTAQAVQCIREGGENFKTLKRTAKSLGKRFKLAIFKEELCMRIQSIRNINEDILTLAKGAQQSSINHRKITSKKELSAIQAYYRKVRDGAQSICNSFRKGILTPHGCGDQNHDLSLCLEMQDFGGTSPGLKTSCASSPNSALHFKIVFSITEAQSKCWKELEVETTNVGSENTKENEQEDRHEPQGSASTTPQIIITKDDPQGAPSLPRSPKTTDNHPSPQPSRPTTPTKSKRVSFSSFCTKLFSSNNREDDEITQGSGTTSTTMATIQLPGPSREPSPGPSVVRSVKRTLRCATTISEAEAQIIEDICLKIQQSTPTRCCLGFLKGDAVHTHPYHRVWSMPVGGCFGLEHQLHERSTAWNSEPISLCTLFRTQEVGTYSIQDRLSLGINLASSVIQLHQTLWLHGSWSKQDIVFFKDPQNNLPLIEKPLVLQKLTTNNSSSPSGPPQPPASQGVTSRTRNRCYSEILLPLGILLCELWHWKCLEDFSFCHSPDLPPTHSQTLDNYLEWSDLKLIGAVNLAHKGLCSVAPRLYCQAVATCLSNDVLTDDHEFVKTVWESVLCLLKENLSHF